MATPPPPRPRVPPPPFAAGPQNPNPSTLPDSFSNLAISHPPPPGAIPPAAAAAAAAARPPPHGAIPPAAASRPPPPGVLQGPVPPSAAYRASPPQPQPQQQPFPGTVRPAVPPPSQAPPPSARPFVGAPSTTPASTPAAAPMPNLSQSAYGMAPSVKPGIGSPPPPFPGTVPPMTSQPPFPGTVPPMPSQPQLQQPSMLRGPPPQPQMTARPPPGQPTMIGQPSLPPQASQAPPFMGQPGLPPQASQAPPFMAQTGLPPSASQPVPFTGQVSQPTGVQQSLPLMGQPTSVPQTFTFPGQSQPQMVASQSTPFMGQPSPYAPLPGAPPGPQYGAPAWQAHARMGSAGTMPPSAKMPGMPGMMPPQSIAPMPGASMPYSPHAGTQVSTPSKIDPNQIPRPIPETSGHIFETRQGNQAGIPPPASSNFIVKDTGNCSPRLMRCTMNQIPCTAELLATSCMPLALMVQPFALPHPSDTPIQLVDFGEMGPIRCSRCKAYINPFMRFADQGRHFICNLCGFSNDTPREYMCNLGPDGRRRDADERPELYCGTVEFVANKSFMIRDPMPAVFFFLIDVSVNAVQTGATAAACSAIKQAIADLPEGPRTMVGVATFDCTIHFYNLKRAQQQSLMLIVPDVQDVYTPLQTDLIVPLSESREVLEQLLDNIPNMFMSNRVADSAFGAAVKAGFLAMKSTGGKLLVFQSVLPSIGIGSLSSREAEGRANVTAGDKEAHKLLQPADKTLGKMAEEFAEYQVCVDVFLTTQSFVDIASISVIPRTTGGQVYYYHPFSSISDPIKLYNDLRWNVSRPQGFEAVMRVRCSQGLQVQDYSGNFCKRVTTDIDLPGIDADKTIMVSFKHDDKFQEGAECGFQCAILYTTVYGERRIRVINLSLPCTNTLQNIFRFADLDTQCACLVKQAANGIPTSPLSQVREQAINTCINILHAYRRYCASVSSSGQLILPEALKLLPLYTLALTKSIGLRHDGRLDDRSYWVTYVSCVSTLLALPLLHPRLISIHDLTSEEHGDSPVPPPLPLSSEHLHDDGIYLLENGEDALIFVGNSVNENTLKDLFGAPSLDGIPSQLVLREFDNDASRSLNAVVNEIRRQRCSYLRLRLCKKGDPSGMLFLSNMVEDKTPGSPSYVEFLVNVHRQIQAKIS